MSAEFVAKATNASLLNIVKNEVPVISDTVTMIKYNFITCHIIHTLPSSGPQEESTVITYLYL